MSGRKVKEGSFLSTVAPSYFQTLRRNGNLFEIAGVQNSQYKIY